MWWRRISAVAIDFFPVALVIEVLFGMLGYGSLLGSGTKPGVGVAAIIGVCSIAFYFGCVMTLTNGQTLGKWLLGMRVTTSDEHAPRLWRVVWREAIVKVALLAVFVNVGGLLGVIGFLLIFVDGIWAVWDADRRPLHDVLAGTRVVKCG
jgi:uncharacterized RDD family membrane protein YckC